jgi:hypothetical protein
MTKFGLLGSRPTGLLLCPCQPPSALTPFKLPVNGGKFLDRAIPQLALALFDSDLRLDFTILDNPFLHHLTEITVTAAATAMLGFFIGTSNQQQTSQNRDRRAEPSVPEWLNYL